MVSTGAVSPLRPHLSTPLIGGMHTLCGNREKIYKFCGNEGEYAICIIGLGEMGGLGALDLLQRERIDLGEVKPGSP